METAGKNICLFQSRPFASIDPDEDRRKNTLIYLYFSPKLNYLEDLQG